MRIESGPHYRARKPPDTIGDAGKSLYDKSSICPSATFGMRKIDAALRRQEEALRRLSQRVTRMKKRVRAKLLAVRALERAWDGGMRPMSQARADQIVRDAARH